MRRFSSCEQKDIQKDWERRTRLGPNLMTNLHPTIVMNKESDYTMNKETQKEGN